MKWGHLQENHARGVELPKLKCVRPKTILSGLPRGELFALRWRDIDEQARLLTAREAVYDGVFATPKTEAGARQIPFSGAALTLIADWKAHVGSIEAYSSWSHDRGVPANVVALIDGAPCRTRTCDLLVRSQTLYPAELRAREGKKNDRAHGRVRRCARKR